MNDNESINYSNPIFEGTYATKERKVTKGYLK